MDGQWFDPFAKAVTRVLSQLRALIDRVIATTTGRRRRNGEAQPRPCTTDSDCPGGQRCCAGICRDLQSDPRHCGSCDAPCEAERPACCAGRCRNLQDSPDNCGACGNVCGEGAACLRGECCPPEARCGLSLCCRGGEICLSGEGLMDSICCPARQVCLNQCCPAGEECYSGPEFAGCCQTAQICPDPTPGSEASSCCLATETCIVGTGCCPNRRVCGPAAARVCCRPTQDCVNGVCTD
jgi:hypothetical protein